MELHDRIYGMHTISDPVITQLLQTKPLQRLKKINQAGASAYLFPWKDVSRYEHSVGVMLLLRRFGATLPEQVAGLLHDLPHTAFSHVADFVFANPAHEFHELFHEAVVTSSEIVTILKKHRLPLTVIHPEHFGLLERPIPDLCADRIDYALRDFFAWKKDWESVKVKLSGLTVQEGEFCFASLSSAEAFAQDYLKLDQQMWNNPREGAVYTLLAQAIQHALDRQLLSIHDLFTDDETVMQSLVTHQDPYIRKKLAYLTPHLRIEEATKAHHHLYIRSKVRYVDPKITVHGRVRRLSEMSPRYKQLFREHIRKGERGSYINVFRS